MTLKDVQRNWEIFAKADPMWAILTNEEKYGNKWDKDDFFETGKRDVAKALDLLKSANLILPFERNGSPSKAMDFGCGIGRLTQALGDSFAEVHGVDIARPMIDLANTYNAKSNVSYHHNANGDLSLFQPGEFDLIYSLITLQHMDPQHAKGYIKEFLRTLKSNGIAIFQVPSHVRHRIFSKIRRWARLAMPDFLSAFIIRIVWPAQAIDIDAVMEFHCIPKNGVLELVKENGGVPCAIMEDRRVNAHWVSYTYVIKKIR